MKLKNKFLLSAAITGAALALSGASSCNKNNETAKGETGECHGVNECKGQGACHGIKSDGTKYSCAGNNECKGKGFLKMKKEDCEQKGGTFKKSA